MTESKPDYDAIIRSCFEAYLRDDRSLIEPHLADGFTFTSPYDDAIDLNTYWERCWPNAHLIDHHELERVFIVGDEAFVQYRVTTTRGSVFRNVELFRFSGGKVVEVQVYFGRSENQEEEET
jgi:hypothetical protein